MLKIFDFKNSTYQTVQSRFCTMSSQKVLKKDEYDKI